MSHDERIAEAIERYLRSGEYEHDHPEWPGQNMVEGFFPVVEREAVLALLEKSVVFLTADNIGRVLRVQRWLHSAWDLANLYLSSVDAELLGPDAPSLLGIS